MIGLFFLALMAFIISGIALNLWQWDLLYWFCFAASGAILVYYFVAIIHDAIVLFFKNRSTWEDDEDEG